MMSKSVRVRRSNLDIDRISDLPESVITNILSRLPTMDAIRTSVLAKDWEFKWTSIYNVLLADLDIKSTHRMKFLDFLERTLLNLPNIESFRISCVEEYDLSRLTTCMYSIFRRNVKIVEVYFRDDEGEEFVLSRPIVLPRSLLNCESLEILKLYMPTIFKVPVRNHFPNLKKLKLWDVQISKLNTIPDSVFFSFPVLEHFKLLLCEWCNVKSVEIFAPKLIKYICAPVDTQNYEYSVKIVGAKLEKFIIHGDFVENIDLAGSTVKRACLWCNGQFKGDGDALMKIRLQTRKLLRGCSNIKHLELWFLSKALAKSKAGLSLPLFDKLENLDVKFYLDVEGLLQLLHATPCLKFLNLFAYPMEIWQDYDYGDKKRVPSCVVSSLEKVKFGYLPLSMN